LLNEDFPMFWRIPRSDRVRPRTKSRPRLETLEGRQLMSLAAEFPAPINTTLRNTQFASANASSVNGSVTVWTDSLNFTSHDIRAQRLNALGQKVGPEIVVNAGGIDDDQPAVAMDARGDFVVAWRQALGNGDTNVLAQRYNAVGAPIGGVVGVGVGTFREHNPSVAMDGRGDFIVSYTRDTNNNNPDIFAKRYDVNNNLFQVVNVALSPLAENNSSVAMTPDGRFDIAYEVTVSPTVHDILLGQYTASGAIQDFRQIAASGAFATLPKVSVDIGGNAVVAWESVFNGNADVLATRVFASGVQGRVIPIATSAFGERNPSVASEGRGGAFVVAYDADTPFITHVRVAEVSAFNHVTTFDAGVRFNPAVSINSANKYLVTYTSDDTGDFNIRGRFGHL
jgi:hypothetical protein